MAVPGASMSEHTPEPWGLKPTNEGGYVITGPRGTTIAYLPGDDHPLSPPNKERLATARAIQAVPELLKALKAAKERLKDIKYAPDALIWECEAAIAKAEQR